MTTQKKRKKIKKAIQDQIRELQETPLAKTMLGRASTDTVPVYPSMQENTNTPDVDDADEDVNSDATENEKNEELFNNAFQGLDIDTGVEKSNEDEDDDSASPLDTSVRISTAESIIAIIAVEDNGRVRFKVEMAPRAESSSKAAFLAELFASWLGNQGYCHFGIKDLPRFKTQEDMLDKVKVEVSDQLQKREYHEKIDNKVLSYFTKRTVIYTDDEFIRVSTLCSKPE